jgi:hypothetical protein
MTGFVSRYNLHGVTAFQQGDPPRGLLRRLTVEGGFIYGNQDLAAGMSMKGGDVKDPAHELVFRGNVYGGASGKPFALDGRVTKEGWLAAGQDRGSTFEAEIRDDDPRLVAVAPRLDFEPWMLEVA